VLHTSASYAGALDLGFVPGKNAFQRKAKLVYLIGAEAFDESKVADDAIVIYQGHHGDAGAARADIILPSSAYTEKSGTYVNTEGRVQRTSAATGRLANARDDWQILRALGEVLGVTLPYSSLEQVRQRLIDVSPTFLHADTVEPQSLTAKIAFSEELVGGSDKKMSIGPYKPFVDNFYFTDPISRSSRIMAQCASQFPHARNSYLDSGRPAKSATPLDNMTPHLEKQSQRA